MNRTLVGLLALVALLIATPLMAQQRGRGFGRGGGFGITKAALLGNENVQKELEIVADQKEQIAAIVEESRQGRRGGGRGQDLSDEERAKLQKERADRLAAIDKKIDAVLVGPQKTRLNEIYVQALGSLAFTTPDIAKELGIGEDLQEKIADARQEAMRAAFQDGGGGPEAIAKARAESEKAALALLSADQKAKFEKMKGKPVSFDLTTIGRGGRGGRRGGGGNQ
jgi:Spy/CpxP family protein refolding chaperone